MQRIVIVLVLTALFCSCRKKEDTPVSVNGQSAYDRYSTLVFENDFGDMNPACQEQFWHRSFLRAGFMEPCVNPLNPFQICFLHDYSTFQGQGYADLNVFDFATGKNVPLNKNVRGPLDWGPNGWIIFSSGDPAAIYKIKPNGDSLIKLTSVPGAFAPRWSPDGMRFVYYCATCGMNKLSNASGTVLQSLPKWGTEFAWVSDSTLLHFSDETQSDFAMYSLESGKDVRFFQAPAGKVKTFSYDRKSNKILCAGENLDWVDPETGQRSMIRRLRWNKRCHRPSVLGDRFLVHSVSLFPFQSDSCSVSVIYDLESFGMDSTHSWHLSLPN